jgi:hypothetical protein
VAMAAGVMTSLRITGVVATPVMPDSAQTDPRSVSIAFRMRDTAIAQNPGFLASS